MTNKKNKDEDVLMEEDIEKIVPVIKKRKFKVVSYNPKSKMLILERNSKLYQSNCIEYDGVSAEIELDIE